MLSEFWKMKFLKKIFLLKIEARIRQELDFPSFTVCKIYTTFIEHFNIKFYNFENKNKIKILLEFPKIFITHFL